MSKHRNPTSTSALAVPCARCAGEPTGRTPAALAAQLVHRQVHADWPEARKRIVLFDPWGAP